MIRDPSLRGTRYYGRYVYGDLCEPSLRLAFLKRPRAPTRPERPARLAAVSFGEDGRGRVYAVSLSGPVYRIGRGLSDLRDESARTRPSRVLRASPASVRFALAASGRDGAGDPARSTR